MDERIIIGEVVEQTPKGNPVAVTFTDVACNVINYRRLLAMPQLQIRKEVEIVLFDFCCN